MKTFRNLSQRQSEVFEQIATGNDTGHPQRTLKALERRGLIESSKETWPGVIPVTVTRYFVPLPIHLEWCQWCAKL